MIDPETKRLPRLLALLTYLQTKRLLTATELAQRLSVSVRTIYRDIRALEAAGVPVVIDEGKGYRLMEGYRLPPVQFTEEEANALITTEQLIRHNKDGSLTRHYGDAVRKVKAVLQSSTRDKANLLADRMKVYTTPQRDQPSDHLTALQTALTNHLVVRIAYRALSGEASERDVEPFALLLSSDADWLLVAWCRLRQAFRIFRVDHIDKLTTLTESFAPHQLTLQDYFASLAS